MAEIGSNTVLSVVLFTAWCFVMLKIDLAVFKTCVKHQYNQYAEIYPYTMHGVENLPNTVPYITVYGQISSIMEEICP